MNSFPALNVVLTQQKVQRWGKLWLVFPLTVLTACPHTGFSFLLPSAGQLLEYCITLAFVVDSMVRGKQTSKKLK